VARGAYLGGGAEHIPRVWSGGGGGGGGAVGGGKEEDDMAEAIGRIAELSLLGRTVQVEPIKPI
jgi:hypothetical protein